MGHPLLLLVLDLLVNFYSLILEVPSLYISGLNLLTSMKRFLQVSTARGRIKERKEGKKIGKKSQDICA